jgi:hypothetical protein
VAALPAYSIASPVIAASARRFDSIVRYVLYDWPVADLIYGTYNFGEGSAAFPQQVAKGGESRWKYLVSQ